MAAAAFPRIPVGRVTPLTPSDPQLQHVVTAKSFAKPVTSQEDVESASSGAAATGKRAAFGRKMLLTKDLPPPSQSPPQLPKHILRADDERDSKKSEGTSSVFKGAAAELLEEEMDGENAAKAGQADEKRSKLQLHTPMSTPTKLRHGPPSAKSSPISAKSLPASYLHSHTPAPVPPPTSFSSSSQSPLSSSQLPGCLDEFTRTLDKSRNFIQEFKALAESGSSDQESDTEPLTAHLKAAQILEQITSAAKLPTLIDHCTVKLSKDDSCKDFGFSLSDGLGEPGVYIKSIHPGGLAEKSGELRLYDRIMKVCVCVCVCE